MSLIEIAMAAAAVLVVLVFSILRWPARLIMGLAVAFLAAIGIAMALGIDKLRDIFALGFFYAFSTGIFILLIELIRVRKKDHNQD
jgi:hypothetical protein